MQAKKKSSSFWKQIFRYMLSKITILLLDISFAELTSLAYGLNTFLLGENVGEGALRRCYSTKLKKSQLL